MLFILTAFIIGLFSEPKDLFDLCMSLKQKCKRNLQGYDDDVGDGYSLPGDSESEEEEGGTDGLKND